MGLKQSLYQIIPSNDIRNNQVMLAGSNQRQYLVAFVGDFNYWRFNLLNLMYLEKLRLEKKFFF
jgi:hypothetical protein